MPEPSSYAREMLAAPRELSSHLAPQSENATDEEELLNSNSARAPTSRFGIGLASAAVLLVAATFAFVAYKGATGGSGSTTHPAVPDVVELADADANMSPATVQQAAVQGEGGTDRYAWQPPDENAGSQKSCKTNSPDEEDAQDGHADEYRGWYDVQGCGKCYDYCRWVGNAGTGGDPGVSTIYAPNAWDLSYWSCRLAGGSANFTSLAAFASSAWGHAKCSGKGAEAPNVYQLATFEPMDGGLGRACRGSGPTDSEDSYFSVVIVRDLTECKHLCVEKEGCTGVEFNSRLGRCEVWTVEIEVSAAAADYICLRKQSVQPSHAVASMESGCHTATPGDKCYRHVLWAKWIGIHQFSSQYPGLAFGSDAHAIQDYLHRSGHIDCPKPCEATALPPVPDKTVATPKLFCFAVARPGYEMSIMHMQREAGIGIFACNEYAVYSDFHVDLSGVNTSHIPSTHDWGQSFAGFSANTKVFIDTWNQVLNGDQWWKTDFTVKVDPDAVYFPDRLRHRMAPYVGKNVFFLNCPINQDMYGALEVLSMNALMSYRGGQWFCRRSIPWQRWGEDKYMQVCLEKLGVWAKGEYGNFLHDGRCGYADCWNSAPVAFHPFKSSTYWMQCWYHSTRPDLDFENVNGGVGQACRGANVTDDSASYHHLLPGHLSIPECMAMCAALPVCKGVETGPGGRCEVWTRPDGIQSSATVQGFNCFRHGAGVESTPSTSTPNLLI